MTTYTVKTHFEAGPAPVQENLASTRAKLFGGSPLLNEAILDFNAALHDSKIYANHGYSGAVTLACNDKVITVARF